MSSTTPNDSSLIAQVRAGDKDAFGILVERYYQMVYRVACRVIQQPDIAQDRAQEACLQAFLSLDSLRNPSKFRSWLYGITLNVCHAYLRQQQHVVTMDDTLLRLLKDDAPSPEEFAQQRDQADVLHDAIAHLSERNQQAIRLFYFAGLDQKTIAAELSISVVAVKGRLHKARQQLKAHLYLLMGTSGSASHPLFDDIQERHTRMTSPQADLIPITIIDTPFQVVTDENGNHYTLQQLLLFNEQDRRALVIWVDEYLATTTALTLSESDSTDITFSRPTSHDLMGHLLAASGAKIEAVIINDLRQDVYYATVRIVTHKGAQDVDSRPSDAIALALRHEIPIFATKKLWQVASPPIPDGKTPNRSGIQAIMARLDASVEQKQAFFQQLNDAAQDRDDYQAKVRTQARDIIEAAFE